ncbi:MAG TPA: hypothetical protein PKY87_02110 [Terricaulis sp.]|nr:hypothetical protein [Terricaulis sp.]
MQNHKPEFEHAPPPPRHKEGSARVIRVAAIAGILGVAVAGYAIYADEIDRASNTPLVQEQQFAEANESPYAPIPLNDEFALPEAAPTEAQPAGAEAAPEPIEAEPMEAAPNEADDASSPQEW